MFDLEDHFLKNRFPFLSPASEHFGVMVFHFCIAAGFTVGVACLSRWYFEEPFLRLKERLEAPSEESAAFQRAPQTQPAEDLRTA
jgi:peptidoglycan/LPS O-acetylase OafA/YrhL